ncbi:MAG: low molecular weight phosphotyrosine protein phosphatase [Leptonema sp. (in: Bacteria)]|nr:low molecular weight phosphotyrosine protein phosphatase [Leptonema sp. (in: bacteria)]
MSEIKPLRVLFVCHGNICRSPAAEGAFLKLIQDRNLADQFEVDSAGTSSFHVGERPHADTRKAAREVGITLNSLARQFRFDDFDRFDWIIAMDHKNRKDIFALSNSSEQTDKVILFRGFDPEGKDLDVPDPYYGDFDGFQEVQQIVSRTAKELLDFFLSGKATASK